jgi:hypothetical protein
MCRRRSCCQHSRGQAPGVAVVVLITGAGLAADKIGPHVAKIAHVVLGVLRTITVMTLAIVAVAIASWVTGLVIRWWLARCKMRPGRVHPVANQVKTVPNGRSCLACDGMGEVLRSDEAGHFEPRACPECQPARLAG